MLVGPWGRAYWLPIIVECTWRGHKGGGIWPSPNGSTSSLATSQISTLSCRWPNEGTSFSKGKLPWGLPVGSSPGRWWVHPRVCVFHNNLKSPLVPLDRNVNGVVCRDILRDTLMPFVRQHFAENFPCQEDSSMPHHVRVVTAYLQQGDITKMDQPSRSPDCNLWDELTEIHVERLHGLVTSMLRRLAPIIRAIGGSTQYWMFNVVKHSCGKPTAKNHQYSPLFNEISLSRVPNRKLLVIFSISMIFPETKYLNYHFINNIV